MNWPSSPRLLLRATPTTLEVTIYDDGTGLSGDRRSGLANLLGRAARRRGTLSVNDPAPESDTTLVWSVPLG